MIKTSGEIIPSEELEPIESKEIVVNVAGAVEKLGVYRLPHGSRVNGVLVAAGGLSEEADRDWTSRYINLAQLVSDGIKIYIPAVGEQQEIGGVFTQPLSITESGSVIRLETAKKININNATAAELDTLWGIGEKVRKQLLKIVTILI